MSEVYPFEEDVKPDEILIADIDTELDSLQIRIEYLLELRTQIQTRHEDTSNSNSNL